MDENVQIKIGATAEGVGAATTSAKEGLAGVGKAGEAAAVQARTAFEALQLQLKGLATQAIETAEVMEGMRRSVSGIGELITAAFAVEEIARFTEHLAAAAEKTVHLSEQFGLTTNEIQGLQGMAAATGISFDSLTKGLGIMDRNMVNAAAGNKHLAQAFDAVGVSAHDGRDQMGKILEIADKFKNMDDGPKKIALAMTLFGRAGRDLIPFLNMGREGLAELNQKVEEYGVKNEAAVQAGYKLAESVNESHLATLGLTNTLTEGFAPILKQAVDGLNNLAKEFIESYKAGGLAYDVIQALNVVFEVFGAAFEIVGEVFRAVWDVISDVVSAIADLVRSVFGVDTPADMKTAESAWNIFKDVVVIVKDDILIAIAAIKGAILVLIDTVIAMAKIVNDAMHLNWGAIQADWNAGLAKIEDRVRQTAATVKSLADNMGQSLANALNGKGPAGGGGGVPLPHAGGGGDYNPTSGGHKPKGAKGPGEMEKWRVEYQKGLLELELQEKDTLQYSVDFWQKKVDTAKKGSKEELEAEQQLIRAKIALHKQEHSESIAVLKERETLNQDAAKNEIALSKLSTQAKIDDLAQERAMGHINAIQEAEERAKLNAQLYALDVALENRQNKIKRDALLAERAGYDASTAAYRDYTRQIEVLDAQHQQKLQVLNAQTREKEIQDERTVLNAKRQAMSQWTQAWSENIAKMVTGQQGFQATIVGIWQNMVSNIEKGIANIVNQWLLGLLTKEAASKGFHAKEVLITAKEAAAHAFSAIVKIPFVGPILAPPAAAAAFAATMAFSAKDGYDVPALAGPGIDGKGGQMGIVHPKEMILPADISDGLRNGGAGGGFHYHDEKGTLTPDQIERNYHAVGKAMKMAMRQGHFAGVKF